MVKGRDLPLTAAPTGAAVRSPRAAVLVRKFMLICADDSIYGWRWVRRRQDTSAPPGVSTLASVASDESHSHRWER